MEYITSKLPLPATFYNIYTPFPSITLCVLYTAPIEQYKSQCPRFCSLVCFEPYLQSLLTPMLISVQVAVASLPLILLISCCNMGIPRLILHQTNRSSQLIHGYPRFDTVVTVRSDEKGQKILENHPNLPKEKLSYVIVKDVAEDGAFDEVYIHVSPQYIPFSWLTQINRLLNPTRHSTMSSTQHLLFTSMSRTPSRTSWTPPSRVRLES